MRIVILLLLLSFCSTTHAKNKTYKAQIKANSISLKSIENAVLYKQSGAEFNGPHSVMNPSYFITPVDATFYYNGNLLFSDHFFNNEEISYKNSSINGGSSVLIFEDQSVIQEKASTDIATIFQQGMFYGFVITLMLLNLVCFFLFDEKTFLWYALAINGSAVLLFFSDGLFSLLSLELGTAIPTIQSLLLLIAVSASAVFANRYLNLKEFLPKLKWLTISLISIASVAVVFSAMTQKEVFSAIANVSLFTALFVYFNAGIYLFSRKNYAKFYVIASFIPLLFCIDFFVLNPLGIEFLSTQTFHIKAAVISEMLILTYGNMFRMQAIKEENELRQVEMRIFLKRQEALSARQKTEKLVEDVYLENLIMHYDLDGLEIKLLQYISEGKDNVKIARKLNSTESEIEEMTKDLYEKLEIGEQIQQDYRIVEQQPDYIYN